MNCVINWSLISGYLAKINQVTLQLSCASIRCMRLQRNWMPVSRQRWMRWVWLWDHLRILNILCVDLLKKNIISHGWKKWMTNISRPSRLLTRMEMDIFLLESSGARHHGSFHAGFLNMIEIYPALAANSLMMLSCCACFCIHREPLAVALSSLWAAVIRWSGRSVNACTFRQNNYKQVASHKLTPWSTS